MPVFKFYNFFAIQRYHCIYLHLIIISIHNNENDLYLASLEPAMWDFYHSVGFNVMFHQQYYTRHCYISSYSASLAFLEPQCVQLLCPVTAKWLEGHSISLLSHFSPPLVTLIDEAWLRMICTSINPSKQSIFCSIHSHGQSWRVYPSMHQGPST